MCFDFHSRHALLRDTEKVMTDCWVQSIIKSVGKVMECLCIKL
jgi:hypothetical protein